ncbi:MAG: protein translocase subunit SecF [Candidatus Nealsonbacteria bacterium]|nr:protein translocase subunit SecF [Candidatus Nealsonbacteria bacterium]
MVIRWNRYRKIYFFLSLILVLTSFFILFKFGLKFGIDFTGGSIWELEYSADRPQNQEIRDKLAEFNLRELSVQPVDEKGVIIRTKDLPEETHQKMLAKLKEDGQVEEKRFESIGPVIGQELKDKTKTVVVSSLLLIVLYIAFAFRKVSRPINSWQYGLVSLLMLLHDILIPLAVFSLLGEFAGVQITIPIVTAFLTVVGYAINNVVVVYDRIRENLFRESRVNDFEEIVNLSVSQTLSRQINTSLTTLFPLIGIFLLGGETLKYFSLTLILGIGMGAYSSIFLASPILVSWLKMRKRG